LQDYAEQFTLKRAAEITGVAADTIATVAEYVAEARPRIASWVGTGLEHHINGVNNIRAAAIIDALAGAIDRKGGMRIPKSFELNKLTIYDEKPLRELQPIGADRFPVLYEQRQECHTLLLMDQILSGQPYPFKGLLMIAANPALTNANTGKVIKALSQLELFVVKDLFMTETARLADYVLPGVPYIEREELFFNGARHAAFISGKYIDNGLPTELDLFKGLAARMGAERWFPWADDHQLTEWLLQPTGYTARDLQSAPGGFVFSENEYEKHLIKMQKGQKPFATPSGKIEFFSGYLQQKGLARVDGLPKYYPPHSEQNPQPQYPFVLGSGARKQKYFHGRYRNIPQLYQAEPRGCLEMHPQDAARLGLAAGDKVKVSSRIGSFDTYVQIMHEKELAAGYVQHTHGYAKENVNWVTYDDICDPISGFPVLKNVQVSIEKLD
jgi:anaerobic selenocysteine-containing dehydrogenase